MKHTTLIVLLMLIAPAFVSGQHTSRKNLKPKPIVEQTADYDITIDTVVAPEPSMISVNGYDKPLRSRRETFFATNNSDKEIVRLAFTISYQDSRQRMLHEASHSVATSIPAGETRQITIRSWDPQFNFYYHRSVVPQRAQQATPYDISMKVDTIFFSSSEKF